MNTLCLSKQRKSTGFSLVEVVIALGIFSVAVIGIFGLIGSSAESSRSSSNDTILAALTTKTVAELHSKPFSTLFTDFTVAPSLTYCREDGTLLDPSVDQSKNPLAFYGCSIQKNQATGGSDSANVSTATYLDFVIEFSWPINTPSPKKLRIPVRIARYE